MKVALILVFVSLTAFGQSTKIGIVTFKTIQEDGKPKETVRGKIEVFENNLKNKGRKINLNIEVVPAQESDNKAEPMFIIMGGPGQAATDLVPFFSDIFKSINERSDLVFIDQRGTGKSNPLQLGGTYNNLPDYFKDNFIDKAFLGDYWISRVTNSCAIWNPQKREVKKTKISKQDTPVLIISGNRDGATPPKYGDEVLKYFSNGRHVVVNSGCHSFDGMRNCVENIICDFVTTGQNKILKTDCVHLIKFPEYKVN